MPKRRNVEKSRRNEAGHRGVASPRWAAQIVPNEFQSERERIEQRDRFISDLIGPRDSAEGRGGIVSFRFPVFPENTGMTHLKRVRKLLRTINTIRRGMINN